MTRSEFKKNWGVLSALVSKDFKRKYRRSVLGILWSVLNPLLMMVIMTAVFSYMFKFNIEHFPLYLILGNILFGLMSTATCTAMTSIVDSSSLIKKIRIEKAIFPIEKVIFALVNFVFSLIAAVCVMIYLQVFPSWQIILLPVLLLFVVLFSMGLGLLLSALGVFFRRRLPHLGGLHHGLDLRHSAVLPHGPARTVDAAGHALQSHVPLRDLFP